MNLDSRYRQTKVTVKSDCYIIEAREVDNDNPTTICFSQPKNGPFGQHTSCTEEVFLKPFIDKGIPIVYETDRAN